MRDMVERRSIAWAIPSRRTSPIVTTRLPAVDRILVHRLAVGEAGEPDLGDVRAGQPVVEQRAHRIAVAQTLVGVAHVEMRVERDQADLVERPPSAEHRRPRHRIVAADEQGQRVRFGARRDRIADQRRRLLDASGRQASTSPRSATAVGKLAPGLDVVAADPPQRRAQQRGREVAASRRHRSRRQRRAEQPDRRLRGSRVEIRSERLGQPAIALTLAPPLA